MESMDGNNGENKIEKATCIDTLAYESIIELIVKGSCGKDNSEIHEDGLRFVRFLLANSKAAMSGFLPNFKDMKVVEAHARNFIKQCGNSKLALNTLKEVTQS